MPSRELPALRQTFPAGVWPFQNLGLSCPRWGSWRSSWVRDAVGAHRGPTSKVGIQYSVQVLLPMGLSDLDCKMSHVIQANVTLRSCCGDSDEKIFRNRVSHTRMQSQGDDGRQIKAVGARVRWYKEVKAGLGKSLQKASPYRPIHGFQMHIGEYFHQWVPYFFFILIIFTRSPCL